MKLLRRFSIQSGKSGKHPYIIDGLLVLLLIGLGLVLGFHRFSFSSTSHDLFARRVQKVLLHEDDLVQQTKTDVIYHLDHWNHAGVFPVISIPEDLLIYVYRGDSLVYWNSNLVEPKMLRKRVDSPTDTLVNLNNGDYLVSSDHYGVYSFYVFSLVNTTYPIQNDYFVNRFLPIFGNHQLHFGSDLDGYALYSRSGKLLTYFTIDFPSVNASPNLSLLLTCSMLAILCVYLLCLRFFVRFFRNRWRFFSTRLGVVLLGVVFLVFSILSLWWFRGLCQSFFGQHFFIPNGLKLDHSALALFLFILLVFTMVFFTVRVFVRSGMGWKNWNEALVQVILFVLWSVALTLVYNSEYKRFENQRLQRLAQDLSEERDARFEVAYPVFLDALHNDTVFQTMVLSEDVMEEVVEDYMRSFLFDTVMLEYTVSLTLCDPGQELVVQPYDMIADCETYFWDKIHTNNGLDLGHDLFFMDYNSLDPSYLSVFTFSDSMPSKTMYLEFTKPITAQGFGLPKILQHERSVLPLDYSVACYKDSLLVYKVGSYIYPNYLMDYQHKINEISYGRRLKHFAYQSDPSKVLAVCTHRRGWMELTAPFAMFFFALLFLYLLVYLLGGIRSQKPIANTWRNKFQMMVLIALGISFLVVGPISVIFMRGLYTQKANDYHFERTRTLLLDVMSEVDFSFLRQPGFKTALDEILRHYSETFFTDINIYGLDGKLLATTSPELTELHLLSSLMNAEAFHNMQGEKTLYYIHDETLGKAVYQSAYISIQDGSGKTLAYLNTPYFASQSELRSEILNYVLTYVNIILAIIFVILPLVLLLTRRFTYPLTQLQEKMRQVDLNKSNELLEWKSKDEIGDLIGQYNQLVVALEKSAAELRRTTSETAWRGVARQVAHEIKNSLTPMRLSVQMLQRSMENGTDSMDERVQRTAATLLEQIDALSDIASSFSRYAKLPENHPAPLDLAELVGNVVNLYDNAENIHFSFVVDKEQDFTYQGDKTNLNSAIGNIIKNAVQAIGSKPNGRIDVSLKALNDKFSISVKDNGKGIKEEDKPQIFLPNFTTKTGGSGVGLSLAYNIIQSAGGTIRFESQEGVGTEFVIELQK